MVISHQITHLCMVLEAFGERRQDVGREELKTHSLLEFSGFYIMLGRSRSVNQTTSFINQWIKFPGEKKFHRERLYCQLISGNRALRRHGYRYNSNTKIGLNKWCQCFASNVFTHCIRMIFLPVHDLIQEISIGVLMLRAIMKQIIVSYIQGCWTANSWYTSLQCN